MPLNVGNESTQKQYNVIMLYQSLINMYGEIAKSNLIEYGVFDRLQTILILTEVLAISAKSKSSEEDFNVINSVNSNKKLNAVLAFFLGTTVSGEFLEL